MNHGIKYFVLSILVAILLTAWIFWPSTDDVGEGRIVVYCAAGLAPPVEAAAREFVGEFPQVEVRTDFGGSGELLSRIRAHPAGDLYLAADASYIDLAHERGLIAERLPLVHMRPVIVVARGNPEGIRTVADLVREDVQVSLANPDVASIGKQVRKILQSGGQWQQLAARVKVFQPTVNHVANDVKLGAVDAGIVWDAVANQYPELESVHLPAFDARAFEVTIAVLKTCGKPALALRFARYLQAPEKGARIFRELGYDAVDGDAWEPEPELTFFSGGVNRLAIESTLREFETREGVKVNSIYNGCGILTAQMKGMVSDGVASDQFPDAYFSCDVSFMTQVSSLFEDSERIAETDMVILAPRGNPRGIKTLADLAAPGLKVGVAHPTQSALGALTDRLLLEVGVRDAVRKNVATETPTADLLVNQMQAKTLDAAIVYRANTPNVADELEIIDIDHPAAKAVQPIAVSRSSRHKYLMQRLVSALHSATSRQRFEGGGFRWLAAPKPGAAVE